MCGVLCASAQVSVCARESVRMHAVCTAGVSARVYTPRCVTCGTGIAAALALADMVLRRLTKPEAFEHL